MQLLSLRLGQKKEIFHFLRTKTSRVSFLSVLDAFQTVAQQSGPGAPCARLLTSGDECEDDRDPVSLKQDEKLSPSQIFASTLKYFFFLWGGGSEAKSSPQVSICATLAKHAAHCYVFPTR